MTKGGRTVSLTLIATVITFLLLLVAWPHSLFGGDPASRIGKDVVFVELDSSLSQYGYMGIGQQPDFVAARRLPYSDYVGKTGKVLDIVSGSQIAATLSYWKIELETGAILFAARVGGVPQFEDQIDGMYFIEDYEAAKRMIGHTIWVNQAEWHTRKQTLITEDRGKSFPIDHLEKVKVIGVFTRKIGHAYGGAPFFLKTEKTTREVGLVGYRRDNYFEQDPIVPSWDPKIREAIRSQKVVLGMTAAQIVLALGKPKKTNRTVTRAATREQWIYDGPVLYLEDDKLISFQESK